MELIVGTADGVCAVGASGTLEHLGLRDAAVHHVVEADSGVLAAVPHDGLYRIDARGERKLWEGDARSCAVNEHGAIFVGAEPAMVFRSRDGGRHWVRLDAIDELPTRSEWSFPPPPHEPHVLSIDFVPGAPDSIVAGIEVGGAIRSDDEGDTWQERNDGLYVDVHSLRPDPEPGVLFAVTGRGFYASEDGGEHWERRMEGIERGYTIGLACNPHRTRDVFVASGEGPPGVNARLYRSSSGGREWAELPPLPDGDQGRAPVPFFADGAPHVGTERGSVLRLDEAHDEWGEVAQIGAPVTCVFADGVPSSVMH